jgi:hypothetical protein
LKAQDHDETDCTCLYLEPAAHYIKRAGGHVVLV